MDSLKISLARDLLKEKNYGQALVVVNGILATDPTSIEALWILSTAYFELGDDASAEKYLRAYLDGDPLNADAIIRLSTSLTRQGRKQEATACLQQSVEQINNPALCAELASLLLDQGDSDRAIVYANQSLRADAQNLTAKMVLGAAFILLGAPNEALKYLCAAREIAPSNPQVHINLAAVHELRGETRLQLESLNMALLCDASLNRLLLIIGDLYFKQGQLDAAIEAFSKYLNLDADSTEAHFAIALSYQFAARYELAKQHLLLVVRAQPDNIDAWCRLGQCFAEMGSPERALKCCEQILNLDAENAWAQQYSASREQNSL